MRRDPLKQLRQICLAFSEATEKEAWQTPTFRVRNKMFAMYTDNHHGDGRTALWCKAPAGVQQILVGAEPDRFFVPPYVGHKGWVGVYLDSETDWEVVRDLVKDSYRMTAPKRGAALLGAVVLIASFCLSLAPGRAHGGDLNAQVARLAGKNGVVYAVDGNGRALVDLRGSKSFIPASTLKVFTCLLAIEELGADWRFETDFFLDGNTLVARGKGDPFLVSEELDVVAGELRKRLGGQELDGVAIDDSFFQEAIRVPGVGGSARAYDAPNSATSVNFNSIGLVRKNGKIASAEKQTPLTPLALELAKRRGVRGKMRISLEGRPVETRRYAAELIAAKLRAAGVDVGNRSGARRAPATAPLYVHRNSRSLADVCRALLYHSNNYIANQIFLGVGAAAYGAPATLHKGVAAARRFIARHPELDGLVVTEGSGISYENRATGRSMAALLELFAPYEDLLRRKHGTPSKTGTLKAVSSLAGYLDTPAHGVVRFVIALEGGPESRRWKLLDVLRRFLQREG